MLHLIPQVQAHFPSLAATNHSITSPQDPQYNCIAWAAGEDDVRWWPDPMYILHWPDGVPRLETIAAFIQAYSTIGYAPCSDGNIEQGFEKVALYALNGKPTHAARQLSNGEWTSKLGPQWDISHTINALDGPSYGSVVQYLKRPMN